MATLGSFDIGVDASAAAALAVGDYSGTVSVTTSSGLNVDIPVALTVDPMPPAELLSSHSEIISYDGVETVPSSFEAFTTQVTVSNNGVEGAPDLTGDITSDQPWVILSGDTTSLTLNNQNQNSATFVIDIDRNATTGTASLTPGGGTGPNGEYVANITIDLVDPFAVPFQKIIQVLVTVVTLPAANPRVTVLDREVTVAQDSKTIIFAGIQGDGSSISAITDNTVLIENIVPSPASNLVTTSATVYSQAYLNISPDTFNVPPETSVTATVDIDDTQGGALATGSYTSTITLQLDSVNYVVNIAVFIFDPVTPIVDDGQVTKVKNLPRYSEYTQHIMNQLPEWHAGRRQRDSLVSRVVDAVGGRVLQDIDSYELQNFVNHKSFTQANVFNPYEAYFLDINRTPRTEDTQFNMLLNSNFEYWTNPVLLPDNWQLSITDQEEHFDLIAATNTRNFIGGQLLSFSNVDPTDFSAYEFGDVELFQELTFDQDEEKPGLYTYQFWYDVDEAALDESTPQFFNFVKITYHDGSVDNGNIVTVKDASTRSISKIQFSTDNNKSVASIKVGIRLAFKLGAPLSVVNCSNFMLYRGGHLQGWMPNVDDIGTQSSKKNDGIFLSSVANDGTLSSRFTEIEGSSDLHKRLLPSHAEITYVPPDVLEGGTPITAPILLEPHWHFTDKNIRQAIVVATPTIQQFYDWPSWTLGRLVKFDLIHTHEIYGTYELSFPIWNEEGYSYKVSSVRMQACTKHLGHLWVLAKMESSTAIKYTKNYGHALFVIDMNTIPKMENNEEPDHENIILHAPVKKSYFFESDAYTPYDHYSFEFESRTRAISQMNDGIKSIIDLKYNYFVTDDDTEQIALLRNPTSDNGGSGIVIS